MLQLWDGVRAKTLENKIKAIDEKFNICFMQASTNASIDARFNSSKPKNANAKKDDTAKNHDTAKNNDTAPEEKDGPKMATMCKAEKAELNAVHDEIKEELANYMEVIRAAPTSSANRQLRRRDSSILRWSPSPWQASSSPSSKRRRRVTWTFPRPSQSLISLRRRCLMSSNGTKISKSHQTLKFRKTECDKLQKNQARQIENLFLKTLLAKLQVNI